MSAMILCPACQRHLFECEVQCPFCGLPLAGSVRAEAPACAPDAPRVQRFAAMAAVAVSVAAAAACGGPQNQKNNNADSQNQQQQQQEQQQNNVQDPDRDHRDRPPCVDGVCPPYGCVFPDDACDILRV